MNLFQLHLLSSMFVFAGSIIALILLITAYIYSPHWVARKHFKKIDAKLKEMIERLKDGI